MTSSPSIGKRPVVAIDVDEVLGQFVPQLCHFHNESFGTELTSEDFTCYKFHEVWGGTREQADAKMRQFFESNHFLEGKDGNGIPVVEGAAQVLRKHSDRLDLHIVTSRQNIIEEHTRAWVDANYGGIFRELHFGNHFSKQGEQRSKPDLCHSIDAVMIIDDNMRYATQCATAGIKTCLFGDYAWNRAIEEQRPLPDNLKRVFNWAEVDAALDTVGLDHDAMHSAGGEAAKEFEAKILSKAVDEATRIDEAENSKQPETQQNGQERGD